ncbi:MAG: hypothetical protein HYS35_08290 [Betaproteobacteria bacterium]|nr:hypothetical protein [Betaproteobacteria bacterium]
MAFPCSASFRDGQGHDFHHAPDDVQHGRHRDAEKQQQERVVEQLLHHRDRLLGDVFLDAFGAHVGLSLLNDHTS